MNEWFDGMDYPAGQKPGKLKLFYWMKEKL
jgi:hypothetical protein